MFHVGILLVLLLAALISMLTADRSTTIPIAWFWRTGSVNIIRDQVNDGYRIVNIQVLSISPYTLTALFVRNAGPYAKTWYWFWNIDAAALSDKVNALTARIVDLEPYTIAGRTRFCAVLHKNTGPDAKKWWYYHDVSLSYIGRKLNENKARLIDVDTYSVSSSTRYSAIMISNTGADARSWWWYYNATPYVIAAKLRKNKAQLVVVERSSPGRYTVIMERTSLQYWYYYGQTSTALLEKAAQNGARIVEIEPYVHNGIRRYVGIMVSNVNPLTRRVADYMSSRRSGGAYGLYMRQIAGPKYASLLPNYVYETASSIKALHLAHAMKRVQNGTDSLNNRVSIFTDMVGSCPQNSGSSTETLELTLTKMMRQSSNSHTQAILARYGKNAINKSAKQQLGMTSSGIYHHIGCAVSGHDIIGQIDEPNKLTLEDIAGLYGRVATTSFLTGTYRTKFFNIMSGYRALYPVIDQEASQLPSITNAIRDDFKTHVFARQKGGAYIINNRYYRSIGAYVKLPFRTCTSVRSDTKIKQYVLGAFIHRSTIPVASGVIHVVGAETMRDEIRKALISFQCFTVVPGTASR